MSDLRIDGDRLWRSLMELAQIGATPRGGVARLALTDLDRDGRDWLVARAREAGMTVTVDRIGNVFMRRAGRKADLPPVMAGSHIDTQPTGGKFDGNYGVLAGLEVIRTLADHGYAVHERRIDALLRRQSQVGLTERVQRNRHTAGGRPGQGGEHIG